MSAFTSQLAANDWPATCTNPFIHVSLVVKAMGVKQAAGPWIFLYFIYIFFLDCTIVYIAIASDRVFSRRHGCIVSKDFLYDRDSGHELEAHDAT
jgi:hypothetical protein